MARIARIVVPNLPHHVTQRGNRRQPTFFRDEDYEFYIALMAEWCSKHGVEVWAYCLMPNHVHLVAVPGSEDGLRKAIGEAHRRYTQQVNAREGWTGHLWQGRFASFVMDERHLLAAARYVELNPVQAGMVEKPWEYRWSSARAHVEGRGDALIRVPRLLEIVKDWRGFLELSVPEEQTRKIEKHERTGRPLGAEQFVAGLEAQTGLRVRKMKTGPKPRTEAGPILVSAEN